MAIHDSAIALSNFHYSYNYLMQQMSSKWHEG